MIERAQARAGAANWNGAIGTYWVNRQDAFDAVLAPVGDAAIARALVKSGDRVIDVGCGCGTTTIELARRTGPGGHVLGIDISKPMLSRAAERIPPGQSIEFVEADATTYAFQAASYDVLFSRVGIMFFPDPVRAFTNMRRALRPGGRISLACIRTPQENPYLTVPLAAAQKHVPPRPKPGPEDPGLFSFANEERVRRILGAAGFVSIALEAFDAELDVAGGGDLDTAVEISMEFGPTGSLLVGQSQDTLAAAAASIREALTPYRRGTGVWLGGGLWIVTAGNP